jgi:hypothetical protein
MSCHIREETTSDIIYEDIDSQDRDNPQAVAEYAEEIYQWLREKEVVDILFSTS